MKSITLQIFTVTATLILAGCATENQSTGDDTPQLESVDVSSLTLSPDVSVAVLPFEVTDNSAKAAGFEATYYAGELINGLQNSKLRDQIFFAPESGPATDYVVHGTAQRNGENVLMHLDVQDVSGRQVLAISFKEDDLDAAASQVLKAISNDNFDGQAAGTVRLIAYNNGQPVVNATDREIRIAAIAAQVERERLLRQYTSMVLTYVQNNQQVYEDYQDKLSEITDQKRQEEREQNQSAFNGIMSGLAGVGAAASGNQAGVYQAQSQMQMQQVAVAASEQREIALDSASRQLSSTFGASVQPTSISFLDQIYNLQGSYADQIQSFRELVKKALNSQSAQ